MTHFHLQLGSSRRPKLQAVWQERDNGAHSIRMPSRTDKVLRELADVLEMERRSKRPTDQKPGQTNIRLDAVLVYQQSKTLVAIELTVPCMGREL